MTFDVNGWNQASDDGFTPTEAPPDGIYQVLVTDFKADTSKAGKAYIAVDLQAVHGPHTGHCWSIIGGFGSPGAIGITKSTCARLGVPTSDPSIIHAATPQASLEALSALGKAAAVGHWFAVKVERDGEFTNTYVDSRLAPATQPPPAQAPVAQPPAPPVHTDVPANTASFQPQPQPVPATGYQPPYVQPIPAAPVSPGQGQMPVAPQQVTPGAPGAPNADGVPF